MRLPSLTLALVQLFWALTWVVYVAWLPALAQRAGLAAAWLPWLLMLDQWVMALSDLACGVAADRMQRALRRLGPWLVGLCWVSALAFMALPQAAQAGSTPLLLGLTLLWTATSSALRAPVMAMLGRHVSAAGLPMAAGLWLLGVGVAGALAPYLQPRVRDISPQLAFTLPALALMLSATTLVWAERRLAAQQSSPAAAASTSSPAARSTRPPWVMPTFFTAVGLAAMGFQIHFPVNATPQFLHLAPASQLDMLMPLFWLGFNLALWPACHLSARLGGLPAMALGCGLAALASGMGAGSASLEALVLWQLLAGAGWAGVMLSATSAATAAGHVGHEGRFSSGLFALLALATMARIGLVSSQVLQHPAIHSWLSVLPGLAWAAAAGMLVTLWRTHSPSRA